MTRHNISDAHSKIGCLIILLLMAGFLIYQGTMWVFGALVGLGNRHSAHVSAKMGDE